MIKIALIVLGVSIPIYYLLLLITGFYQGVKHELKHIWREHNAKRRTDRKDDQRAKRVNAYWDHEAS